MPLPVVIPAAIATWEFAFGAAAVATATAAVTYAVTNRSNKEAVENANARAAEAEARARTAEAQARAAEARVTTAEAEIAREREAIANAQPAVSTAVASPAPNFDPNDEKSGSASTVVTQREKDLQLKLDASSSEEKRLNIQLDLVRKSLENEQNARQKAEQDLLDLKNSLKDKYVQKEDVEKIYVKKTEHDSLKNNYDLLEKNKNSLEIKVNKLQTQLDNIYTPEGIKKLALLLLEHNVQKQQDEKSQEQFPQPKQQGGANSSLSDTEDFEVVASPSASVSGSSGAAVKMGQTPNKT
jgi:hypothetical protein